MTKCGKLGKKDIMESISFDGATRTFSLGNKVLGELPPSDKEGISHQELNENLEKYAGKIMRNPSLMRYVKLQCAEMGEIEPSSEEYVHAAPTVRVITASVSRGPSRPHVERTSKVDRSAIKKDLDGGMSISAVAKKHGISSTYAWRIKNNRFK